MEGDEWKYTKEPPRLPPTRAEMQANIDADYRRGDLNLEQWRRATDHLSACTSTGAHMLMPRQFVTGSEQ